MAVRNSPTLISTFLIFCFLAFAGVLLSVAVPLRAYLSSYERDVQTEIANSAGHALSLAVSRAVEREWDSLIALSESIDTRSLARMQSLTDAVAQASSAIAWAGVATPSGRVVAGTGRLREGERVGDRRWHREGLSGGSVGSAYVPEESRIPGAPEGLINMSTPILGDSGEVQGVLVYSIRIDWLAGYIAAAADALEVDVVVRDQRGMTIVEDLGRVDAPVSLALDGLISSGHEVTRLVENRDEQSHIVAIFPALVQSDMPDFQWRLAVRVPALSTSAALGDFLTVVRIGVVGLFVVSVLAALGYAIMFLRPIERLARNARELERGEDVYPVEDYSSQESAYFSSALSKLQH